MRILYLELRRVLRTPVTLKLLITAFIISGIIAYLPISYVHYSYMDSNHKAITVSGIKAIQEKKRLVLQGKLTESKIHTAVNEYQKVTKKYGSIYRGDFPQKVYEEKVFLFINILDRINEVYGSEMKTGRGSYTDKISAHYAAEHFYKRGSYIDKISADYAAKNFYKKCTEHLKKQTSDKNKNIKQQAFNMYKKVNMPFEFIYGYGSSDAADYLLFLIFILIIICTIITAPIFSSEYQTGSDSILRCTKHGRVRFAITKIISAILISSISFSICISTYIVIEDSIFGWDSLETSLQMVSSAVSLPSLSVGEAQMLTVAAGMLSLFAVVSFTLFISSYCKSTTVSLVISIIFCFLPSLISKSVDNNIMNWIRLILPAGGVGVGNGFDYELQNLTFLKFGSHFIWSPYVIIGAAAIAIPLFMTLTVLAYCKHEAA